MVLYEKSIFERGKKKSYTRGSHVSGVKKKNLVKRYDCAPVTTAARRRATDDGR